MSRQREPTAVKAWKTSAWLILTVLLAHSNAAYPKNFDLEKIEKSVPGDAIYKRKAAACHAYDLVLARLRPEVDKKGKQRESYFFENEKTYKSMSRNFVQLFSDPQEAEEIILDPKTASVVKSFVDNSYEDDSYKRIVKLCINTLYDIAEGKAKAPRKSVNQVANDSSMHKECLEARDYEGCIKVKTSNSKLNTLNSCEPYKWCTATEGDDLLGMPMITGWRMLSNPTKRTVTYQRKGAQKVNVRGNTDRYFAIEAIGRIYLSPTSGSSGSTTTIGSATTNCTGYGTSISCSSTPAPTFSTPSIAGRPGGVYQFASHILTDCKDRTYGKHIDGKLKGKWIPIANTNLEKKAEKLCPIIEDLELSTFDTYSE